MIGGGALSSGEDDSAEAMEKDPPDEIELAEADVGNRFTIHPGLHVSSSWHSNPYYRPNREPHVEAWIVDIDPRLDLELPLTECLDADLFGKLNLKYFFFSDPDRHPRSTGETLEYRSFADTRDADKLIVQPYLRGTLRYQPSERTSLALYDDFQRANVDDVGDQREFYLNNAWLEAAHDFSEVLSGRLWYRHTLHYQTDESPLFDYIENAVGADVGIVLARLDDGRSLEITPNLSYGRKEFQDNLQPTHSLLEMAESNNDPKSHEWVSYGATLQWPFSTLMTLYLSGGQQTRNYKNAGDGRESETSSPWYGATLACIPSPGSRFSYDIVVAYAVSDTVVYNTPAYNRQVFDLEDAILNELDITYRELDVWRAGVQVKFDATERLRLHALGTFQRSEADREEDLAPFFGYSQATEGGKQDAIQQDEYAIGVGGTFRWRKFITLGAGYRWGWATDEKAILKDLYDYHEISIFADVEF